MASVLLVPASYPPVTGGLQSVTSRLAHELHARGHDVRVVTQRFPRNLPAHETLDGVPVTRWLFVLPRLRNLVRGRFDLFAAGLLFGPVTLARLLWLLARTRPDVVNLHFVGTQAPFVLLAHVFARFRLVVSLHGDDVEGLPRGTWFDRWVFRAVLRRAHAVTACSQYLLKEALASEASVAGKSRVVYNGFDPGKVLPHDVRGSIGVLVGMGRLVPSKGWDIALRALAECPGTCFELIGDGPERGPLEALARQLGLDGRFTLRGVLPHAEALSALRDATLVVVPSRRDTFGLVALEAMSAGRPVVATRAGGLPEVLADADALLVPPGDASALAAGIRAAQARLAVDPSFGARNRTLAMRFSAARMLAAYEEVYKPS